MDWLRLFQLHLLISLMCLLKGTVLSMALENQGARCIAAERQALLDFKKGLHNQCCSLLSWTSGEEDCCKWKGVGCDNTTGSVLMLDLRLKDRDEYPIISTDDLEWLSRLSSLESLKMSRTNFTKAKNWLQVIKSHPSLASLDLVNCYFPEVDPSSVSHINSTNSLRVLHLTSSYSLHSTTFPLLLNISNNMVELHLFGNNLAGLVVDSFGNMPALQYVHLYDNHFGGGIPKSLGSLCNLKILDLSRNNLHESLTIMLKNLSGCAKNSLEVLMLSENQISGSLPDFTIFSKLREMFLQRNQLNGKFPNRLEQMSDLEILDVSSNSLNDVISEVHLSNLSKLKQLILSFNSLSFNLSSAWIPPFQLDSIQMASCKLGPNFPSWLRTQNKISYLDISNSEISEVIPSWFWSVPSNLIYLNLSFNNISGQVPNLLFDHLSDFHQIDLSFNWFYGSLPLISANTTVLNLQGNKFSGSLSSLCGPQNTVNLSYLDLSKNFLSLSYLDLSNNLLSGDLSDCWKWSDQLVVLNLENNNFSGTIPASMGHLIGLRSLHLRNNNLSGTFPAALGACTGLKLLDLGENKISGSIASWIGEKLTNLVVVRLRSNGFFGNIPPTICNLVSLQILDLSLNNISGTIPTCFKNLTAMSQNGSSNATIRFDFYIDYYYYHHPYCASVYVTTATRSFSKTDDPDTGNICPVSGYIVDYFPKTGVSHNDFASIVWKGMEQEYGNTLGFVKAIDLSSNKLSGTFPEEMTSLIGLITLNLSRNNLTGSIPREIGRLEVLESLDLSKNHLSGGIPKGLADLSYLSVLDLSNNNFSGKIPTSTQLQSFNATSYLGNPELCGDPLTKKCQRDEPTKPPFNENEKEEDEDWLESLGFRIGMGIGFITGFWAVFGTILLNKSWRHRYFRCLSNIGDWICLTIALKMSKFQRWLEK